MTAGRNHGAVTFAGALGPMTSGDIAVGAANGWRWRNPCERCVGLPAAFSWRGLAQRVTVTPRQNATWPRMLAAADFGSA